MSTRLGHRQGAVTTAHAAALSQRALDAPLVHPAELSVLTFDDFATLRGAFQRRTKSSNARELTRISGGAAVDVGPGTLHVLLALERSDALTACPPDKLLNRYVRPLLRALTSMGATASYFGRDWISVGKRPAAILGFAHDATSGRAVVEAFVAVRTPFTRAMRASFREREPGTLEEITGKTFVLEELAERVVDEYQATYGLEGVALGEPRGLADATELAVSPAWSASVEEAIGEVAAGRDADGALVLGGDFMASRDAVQEVARRVAAFSPELLATEGPKVAAAIVDEVFLRPGVAIEGVKSLASLADVLVRAART